MGKIFVSHASQDAEQTRALCIWLETQGWDDFFVDNDPERGIAAGERWQEALFKAANRCQAVLCLISQAWLSSSWCQKEFALAVKLNKQVFGILIEPIDRQALPSALTENWQLVALYNDGPQPDSELFSQEGLHRLKTGLQKSGLDPHFFAWPPANDPNRSPFPGLRPLDVEDAGIFFGRDSAIQDLMSQIRHDREQRLSSFISILGASGAGKSSFLRAGIYARLQRDDRFFTVLPIIRPEHAVISGAEGLIQSVVKLSKQLRDPISAADIKQSIDTDAAAFIAFLATLLEKTKASHTDTAQSHCLVIAIDQAEELFLFDANKESTRFITLLASLIKSDSLPVVIITTLRSDAYEQLQMAPELTDIQQQTFSLPPIAKGAYKQIIEGPCALLKDTSREIKISAGLVNRLLEDVESAYAKDMLPLLAFTLQRLYTQYAENEELTEENYHALGGLKGAIELSVEQAILAIENDPNLPAQRKECLAIIKSTLIPKLAGIDSDNQLPRRRVANLKEFNDDSQRVIERFVDARLLSIDIDPNGNTTVEPAHESLLRRWSKLREWLEQDSHLLFVLDGVINASRDWQSFDKKDTWLTHSKGRLDDAESILHSHFSEMLSHNDVAYLDACRKKDNQLRDKELAEAKQLADYQTKVASRTRYGLVTALVLLSVSVGLMIWANKQAKEAELQRDQAIEAKRVTDRVTQLQKDILKQLKPELITASAVELINEKLSEKSSDAQLAEAFNALWVDINLMDKIRNLLAEKFITPAELNMLARKDFENIVKAQLLTSLQALYFEWGQYVVSMRMAQDAMKLIEDEGQTADALRKELFFTIAQIHKRQGDYQSAKQSLEDLNALIEPSIDEDKWRFSSRFLDARIMFSTGDLNSALQTLSTLLSQNSEQIEHWFSAYQTYIDYLTISEQIDLAGKQNETLLTKLRTVGSPEQLLEARIQRAHIHMLSGDLRLAKTQHETLLSEADQELGPNHPVTLTVAVLATVTENRLGNVFEAITRENELIAQMQTGPIHTDTASAMTNLAELLYWQGQLEGAESLSYSLLEMQRKLLGNNHPLTMRTIEVLARIYDDFGDSLTAQNLWQELYQLDSEILGENHPQTQRIAEKLTR